MSNFKLIDCSQNCRMTKCLKESEFCSKQAKFIDGQINFGCQEALSQKPEEVRQPYGCNFWDLGIIEMCNICELNCVNNKNVNLQAIKDRKKQIDKIMANIKPGLPTFGINAEQIEKISQSYIENKDPESAELGAEAVSTAEWAQQVFNSAMRGRHIDLAYFKKATKLQAQRLKDLQKKHRKD